MNSEYDTAQAGRPDLLDGLRRHTLALGVMLCLMLLYAIALSIFFIDRPDESKAISAFSEVLVGAEKPAGILDAGWMRTVLLLFNLTACLVLLKLRLVTERTLVFAAIWPMSAYLFTKLYWEFFVFPLCFVRFDLTKRQEIAFIAALVALFALIQEGNLLVLIAFRAILLAQKLGFRTLAPLGFAIAGMLIDTFYEIVATQAPATIASQLERFRYIREIINPEYSMIETAGVFIASMHFFTFHNDSWIIDAAFTLIVLGLVASHPIARNRIFEARYYFLTILCLILGMTEVTHGFQNARYYFFFLPLLADVTPLRQYPLIALVGVLHVSAKLIDVV